jgi:hypothetical protein
VLRPRPVHATPRFGSIEADHQRLPSSRVAIGNQVLALEAVRPNLPSAGAGKTAGPHDRWRRPNLCERTVCGRPSRPSRCSKAARLSKAHSSAGTATRLTCGAICQIKAEFDQANRASAEEASTPSASVSQKCPKPRSPQNPRADARTRTGDPFITRSSRGWVPADRLRGVGRRTGNFENLSGSLRVRSGRLRLP